MTVVAISIQRSSIIVGAKTSKEKGGWFDQWVGTILKVKQLISACLASHSMLLVFVISSCLSFVVHLSPFPKRMLLLKYRSYSNSFPSLFLLFSSSLFSSFSLLLGQKLSAETSFAWLAGRNQSLPKFAVFALDSSHFSSPTL